MLRAVAGVFVRLEQEKATGSGRLLLHGVMVCFSEVQTWPLRACGRESQLGRFLMGWSVCLAVVGSKWSRFF